jgi:NitT/TauT family transport system substrate-binding protein
MPHIEVRNVSHGLKKGDFQEVRMDVNNMVAALAAKTVDAMVNVEPYNSIAEADGIATPIMDFWDVDRMPVLMAATADFVAKNPDAIVAYLKASQDIARDFKDNPAKVAAAIHAFYTSKGYAVPPDTLAKALALVEVNPGSPAALETYLREQADILPRQKIISAIPDWKKALRGDLWAKASA